MGAYNKNDACWNAASTYEQEFSHPAAAAHAKAVGPSTMTFHRRPMAAPYASLESPCVYRAGESNLEGLYDI